jgi:hypothetical protein
MMTKDIGDMRFPIWLLADSEPSQWKEQLESPLDKRHPIRHNIWTSILDVIQTEVFVALGKRVDADRMYLRNAVQDSSTKPLKPFNTTPAWHESVQVSLTEYANLINEHRPRIVLTFGQFAFAFALRATGGEHDRQTATSSQTAMLGNEFRQRVKEFASDRTNVLPLLHRSIAGGNFIAGHDEFCGTKGSNYFEEAGKSLAQIIIQHETQLECWMTSVPSIKS